MSADRITDGLRKELTANMTRAGLLYVSEARQGLNRSQPYKRYRGGKVYKGLAPSQPGQFPKKLSGQLQRGIAFQIEQAPDGPVLVLGVSLRGYPAFLQLGTPTMQPRPWLSLTWAAIQAKVLALLTGR